MAVREQAHCAVTYTPSDDGWLMNVYLDYYVRNPDGSVHHKTDFIVRRQVCTLPPWVVPMWATHVGGKHDGETRFVGWRQSGDGLGCAVTPEQFAASPRETTAPLYLEALADLNTQTNRPRAFGLMAGDV